MMIRKRKLALEGDAREFCWVAMLDLGKAHGGMVRVELDYQHPDEYCHDGCCPDNLPPGLTPGVAKALAKRDLASTLGVGTRIGDTWIVTKIDRLGGGHS